jgi:hypothetical protein
VHRYAEGQVRHEASGRKADQVSSQAQAH